MPRIYPKAIVNKALTTTTEYENLKNEIQKLQNIVESFDLLTFDFEDHHYKHLAEKLEVPELATVKVDGGLFRLKKIFDKFEENDKKIEEYKGEIEDTVTRRIQRRNRRYSNCCQATEKNRYSIERNRRRMGHKSLQIRTT